MKFLSLPPVLSAVFSSGKVYRILLRPSGLSGVKIVHVAGSAGSELTADFTDFTDEPLIRAIRAIRGFFRVFARGTRRLSFPSDGNVCDNLDP